MLLYSDRLLYRLCYYTHVSKGATDMLITEVDGILTFYEEGKKYIRMSRELFMGCCLRTAIDTINKGTDCVDNEMSALPPSMQCALRAAVKELLSTCTTVINAEVNNPSISNEG